MLRAAGVRLEEMQAPGVALADVERPVGIDADRDGSEAPRDLLGALDVRDDAAVLEHGDVGVAVLDDVQAPPAVNRDVGRMLERPLARPDVDRRAGAREHVDRPALPVADVQALARPDRDVPRAPRGAGGEDASQDQALEREQLHARVAGVGDVEVAARRDRDAVRVAQAARRGALAADARKRREALLARVEAPDREASGVEHVDRARGVDRHAARKGEPAEVAVGAGERPRGAGKRAQAQRAGALFDVVEERRAPADPLAEQDVAGRRVEHLHDRSW